MASPASICLSHPGGYVEPRQIELGLQGAGHPETTQVVGRAKDIYNLAVVFVQKMGLLE